MHENDTKRVSKSSAHFTCQPPRYPAVSFWDAQVRTAICASPRHSPAAAKCGRNGIVAIFDLWRCPSDGLLVLRRRFARSAVSPISLAPSTLFYPARLGPVQRLAAPELRTAMEEAGFVRVVMKAQPVSFGASQDGTFKSHLGSSQSYADGSCGTLSILELIEWHALYAKMTEPG